MPRKQETEQEEDLETIAHNAAVRATKEALGDSDYDPDYEDEDGWDEDQEDNSSEVVLKSVERIKQELKDSQEFDLFTDVGDELAKSDLVVKYRVKKAGKFFTEVEHPFSWSLLQKRHGAGHYTVMAFDPRNAQFIKQQTMTLDEPVGGVDSEKSNTPSFAEMMAIMNEQQEGLRQEMKQNEKEKSDLLLTLLASKKDDNSSEFLKVMSDKSDQNMQMMLTMITALKPEDKSTDMTQFLMKQQMDGQKMMLEMMEKMQASTNSIIKDLKEGFEKSFDRLAQSSNHEAPLPEFDAFKVMQLTSEAEERGEKRMREMFDLVDLKSAEKAEFLTNKEPQSAIDKVISGILPALGPMLAGGMLPKGNPTPETQQRGPARKALPNTERGSGTNTVTAKKPSGANQNRANGPVSRKVVREAPKKYKNALDAVKASRSNPQSAPQTVEVEPEENNVTIEVNIENRDLILQTALPLLITSLQTGDPTETAVKNVFNELLALGVKPDSIERDVSAETIDQLINHYELADDLSELLRKFYVRLVEVAGGEIRKPTHHQETAVS